MLGRKRDIAAPNDYTTEHFAAFFVLKIDTVHAATADKPMPPPTADPVHCSLPAFHRLSDSDVHDQLEAVVSDQVKYARPSADVPVARVRQRTPT